MKKWLKNIVTFSLAAALVFSLIPANAYATGTDENLQVASEEEETGVWPNLISIDNDAEIVYSGTITDTINWTVDENWVLRISGTGEIPEDGVYVSDMSANVRSQVTDLVIEEGITGIGDSAFYNLTTLKTVTIAGTVKDIGCRAFYNINNLLTIVLEEGVETIGELAFYNADQFASSISLPSTLKSIGTEAFKDTSIRYLYLSDLDKWWDVELSSFESAPLNAALAYSTAYLNGEVITEIVVPERITEIPGNLFAGWRPVEKIVFHDKVTKIGVYAFYVCSGITELDLPDSITEIMSAAFASTNLKEVTVPPNVKSLPTAFYYCRKLEKINLPDGLTSIGMYAFQNCTSLKSIDIPDSVTFIADGAFWGCSSLSELVIPDNVRRSGGSTLIRGNTILTSITMPISLSGYYLISDTTPTTLVNYVFTPGTGVGYSYGTSSNTNYQKTPWYANRTLTLNVTLEEGITKIGNNMFRDCTGLKELTIPSTVTEIGTYAIPSTTTLYVYEDTYGETYAINRGDSNYVVLCNYKMTDSEPSTCMEQGWAYYTCAACGATKYEDLPLADHIWGESEGTLSDGTELRYCTYGCKTPSFVENCTATDTGACGENLTYTIYNDKYVVITGTGDMYDYDVTDPAPWMGENIIYAKVTDGVTSIGESAFSDCPALERIDVADSVNTIGSYAFYGCTSLKEFTFPENVTAIEASTFEGCEGLEKVYAHKGIETIGASAFKNCDNLTIVGWTGSEIYEYAVDKDIPFESLGEFGMCGVGAEWYLVDGVLTIDGYGDMYAYSDETEVPWYGKEIKKVVVDGYVGTIGDYAFKGMTSLESVELSMNVSTIGNHAFDGCTGLEEIELTIATYVGDYAFSGCTNLKEVTGSDKIVVLGEGSFYNCQSLTTFKIADAASEIPAKAFQGCTGLTSFTLPSQLTTIGESAFEDCSLAEITLPAGLQTIGERAFANNDFTTVALSTSLTTLGKEAFVGCDSLTDFTLQTGNTTYSVANGILYNTDVTTLVMCPPGKSGKVSVPRSVTTIGEGAFSGCKKVTEVTLASSLVTIEEEAFKNSGLVSIEIPAGVKNLEASAFKGCSSLTEITVDEDNTKFKAENGLLLCTNNAKHVLLYFGTESVAEIPEGYYYVEDGFLDLRPEVEKVLLPHSLESFESADTFGDAIVAVYDNAPVKYFAESLGITCESRGTYKTEWSDTDSHTALAFWKLAAFLQARGNSYTDQSGLYPITYTYSPSSNTISVVQTSTVQAMTTSTYFTLTRYGIYNSDVRYDCKLNGSLDNGYYCTIKMQPEDIDGDDSYMWSIYVGKYNSDTASNRTKWKKAASSSLNTMIIGMDTGLYKMTGLQITDFGFTSYYASRSSVHTAVEGTTAEATCTEPGHEADTFCALCGAFIAGAEIPATGHTEVTVEAQKATCTEDGHTEGVQCSVCKVFLTEVETTPKLGHSFTVYTSNNDMTCEEDGTKTAKCDNCEETDTIADEGSATGHTEVIDQAVMPDCENTGLTEGKHCDVCKKTLVKQDVIQANGHTEIIDQAVEPDCENTGLTEGKHCDVCKKVLVKQNVIQANGHDWDEGIVDEQAGTITYTCKTETCGKTKVEDLDSMTRVYGNSRYATSYAIANELKKNLGVDQFETVIIANGENFPDALAGSYLAAKKDAPILMVNTKNQSSINKLQAYIRENLKPGGTIYILGGVGAVADTVDDGLTGYTIERLYGNSRYATNIAILMEAGVTDEEILVCTGLNFADSLSGSATGLPMLLVDTKKIGLTQEQEEFLNSLSGNQFCIVGGTGAVSDQYKTLLAEYDADGTVERVYGNSRQETSTKVAERYFDDPSRAVTASALNFPDGLCGGPLAYAMGAPLILTNAGKNVTYAQSYIAENQIRVGYVLGGTGAMPEAVVRTIFALEPDIEIKESFYEISK